MTSIKEVEKRLINNVSFLKNIESLICDPSPYNQYDSLETMLFIVEESADGYDSKDFKKFWGLFSKSVETILTEFRKKDMFISPNYTQEALFRSINSHAPNATAVVQNVLEFLHVSGLTNPALVIYPMLSFGIDDIGIPAFMNNQRSDIGFFANDFLVVPQQNNLSKSFDIINLAKEQFKMASIKIDTELLHHFIRSRNLRWLHKNPLIVARVSFSSSTYYENEYYLIRYLERCISKLFFRSTIIRSKNLPANGLQGFSTRLINNFSTADIKHYLVFTKNKKKLSPTCIPLHRSSNVMELSTVNLDLPISVDPTIEREYKILSSYIDQVYVKSLGQNFKDKEWVFYDRFKRSIGYFVRSHQSRYEEDAIMYLSIAFEMIYCDGLKNNVTQTLAKNLACLFPDRSQKVYSLIQIAYEARSSIAHEGKITEVDYEKVRVLYVEAFKRSMDLVKGKKLDPKEERPFTGYSAKYIKSKLGFRV